MVIMISFLRTPQFVDGPSQAMQTLKERVLYVNTGSGDGTSWGTHTGGNVQL